MPGTIFTSNGSISAYNARFIDLLQEDPVNMCVAPQNPDTDVILTEFFDLLPEQTDRIEGLSRGSLADALMAP